MESVYSDEYSFTCITKLINNRSSCKGTFGLLHFMRSSTMIFAVFYNILYLQNRRSGELKTFCAVGGV